MKTLGVLLSSCVLDCGLTYEMVRFISELKLGSTKNANALYFTQNGMLKTPRIEHVQAQKQSVQAGGTFCHVQIGRRVSDVVRRARRLFEQKQKTTERYCKSPNYTGLS